MAEIKISEATWSQVDDKDKKLIHEILKEAGSLKKEDQIVGSAEIQAYSEDEDIINLRWNPVKDLCKSACNVAAATAAGVCTAETAGVALVACLAAAEEGRKLCRGRC